MTRVFPLTPLERIAKKAGAKRVSVDSLKEMREAILDFADKVAADAVAVSRHAGRVTVKREDIKLACRRR
ncbi:MAG: NFYB/HAP3 family transcription factor subunit [Candidatus Aenigmatarchaeota archaeon]